MTSKILTDAQLAAAISRCEYCEEKPCRDACPADCSPADFIMAARLMQPEDYRRAAGLIMSRNPLGGVCGGACPDYHCQRACVHRGFDQPVEIPAIQATIIQRAKELGVMPQLEAAPDSGHRVAIVGAGPAAIGAAVTLAQGGYQVELFEAADHPGGACALIPGHRLPAEILGTDLAWALDNARIKVRHASPIEEPVKLLEQGFGAVIVATGLHLPISLPVPGAEAMVPANDFLRHPDRFPCDGAVAIVGGGAIACDCAVVARLGGAGRVELFALENLAELPLTPAERSLLIEHAIEVNGRTACTELVAGCNGQFDLVTQRVELPAGARFQPASVKPVPGSSQLRAGFKLVLVAIGNRPRFRGLDHPAIFMAGDGANGPTTVVEAVAAGKNAAAQVDGWLTSGVRAELEQPTKSHVIIPGWRELPVPLECDFFGRTIKSPFLLSAAPPTDGYEQMRRALAAGWAGGIMKTAFDGLPIHIPGDYMHLFNGSTYGNCDNVSGHSLARVAREVERLVREFPDGLIGASTGGPVTGRDEADRPVWQHNMRMLEEAGAGVVEFSLSCPQGGDGTEGDIVSQSAALTARIVGWLMETGNPEVPKLFKLTGAVTSIAVIIQAIREVLRKYPEKKAGITLANTFPALAFRPRLNGEGRWDEGVIVGMSGEGVAPISNLTILNAAPLGVEVSGNGGPMDYRAAAHFLALGARTVQFCTVAMKYGVNVIGQLHSGLSHLLATRGMTSVAELVGCAWPTPVTGFMELSPTKRISAVNPDLCLSCGNCTRCSYHALSLNLDGKPETDPSKCIGCSICTKKCFSGALFMRSRSAEELASLVED